MCITRLQHDAIAPKDSLLAVCSLFLSRVPPIEILIQDPTLEVNATYQLAMLAVRVEGISRAGGRGMAPETLIAIILRKMLRFGTVDVAQYNDKECKRASL